MPRSGRATARLTTGSNEARISSSFDFNSHCQFKLNPESNQPEKVVLCQRALQFNRTGMWLQLQVCRLQRILQLQSCVLHVASCRCHSLEASRNFGRELLQHLTNSSSWRRKNFQLWPCRNQLNQQGLCIQRNLPVKKRSKATTLLICLTRIGVQLATWPKHDLMRIEGEPMAQLVWRWSCQR